MEYEDYFAIFSERNPELAAELFGIRTLERLLDWMRGRGVNFASLDMITQDEFCHDLLVPHGQTWLAFGMT
jgi:hypothetical protein